MFEKCSPFVFLVVFEKLISSQYWIILTIHRAKIPLLDLMEAIQ